MAGGDESIRLRKKRWHLALGNEEEDESIETSAREKEVDKLLDRLYQGDREGGLNTSRPVSAKWLGKIKEVFPQPIVRVMQKDAIERFGIKKLLSQPAFLEEVEPDVNLVASILTVKDALPQDSLEVARELIRKLAKATEDRLKFQLIDRLSGLIDRSQRIRNVGLSEIDWHLTIQANLKHFQQDLNTIIPETLIGRPRRHKALRRIILLIDQSASMTESFIYAGILASIMASVRSLQTHLVAFDTDVADLTDYIHDPVELLMHGQLGGGTNIGKALRYADQLLEEGPETFVVLISDLFEGASKEEFLAIVKHILNRDSAHLIILLALDDQGTPAYDHDLASKLSSLGVTSFACSPDKFPALMAAAINHEDLSTFADGL